MQLDQLPSNQPVPTHEQQVQLPSTQRIGVAQKLVNLFRRDNNSLTYTNDSLPQEEPVDLTTLPSTSVNVEIMDGTYGAEMSSDAKAFWEQGSVATPKPFYELLDDVTTGKDERPKMLRAADTAILSSKIGRTKLSFTEGEGILDLGDYLKTVEATLDTKPNAQLQQKIQNFTEKFSFLGSKEYEEATEGIASVWLEYLEQSPNHVLNIWTDADAGGVKSHQVVSKDVLAKFALLAGSQAYNTQLHSNPQEWQDGPDAKLIVLDDYIASGASIKNTIFRAFGAANSANVSGLINKAEVQILIAKQDQVSVTSGDDIELPIRAFFRSNAQANAYEMSFSSAHSSMDNGFETLFEWTQDYLNQNKVAREIPLLAHLQRSYRKDYANTPAGSETLLQVVAYRQETVKAQQQYQSHMTGASNRGRDYLDFVMRTRKLDYVEQPGERQNYIDIDQVDELAATRIVATRSKAEANMNDAIGRYYVPKT